MPLFKKIAMWIGIFLGSGLCFLAVLYLTASLLTSGLKKPIESQLIAIRAEDAASAYALTTTTFQASTSFEAFKKFINDYSALRNNEGITFEDRSISNGVGVVLATLISRSKAKTPVLYRLIKENDKWKIESMVLNPSEETILNESTASLSHNAAPTNHVKSTKAKPAPTPIENTQTNMNSTGKAEPITQIYQNQQYRFSMGYPANWGYSQPSSSMVIFSQFELTPTLDNSGRIIVTLQSLATYANRSVQTFVDHLAIALHQKGMNGRLIEDAMIPTLQGKIYQGRFLLFQYKMGDQDIYQLDVIYFKKPSRALYFLEFTAPSYQFFDKIETVKAMVETFSGK